MSCEVIAIPYAIAWVIGTVAAGAATAAAENLVNNNTLVMEELERNDVKQITAEHFLEKDFETPFVDKEILLKTLEEHGAMSINDSGLEITCSIDKYTLFFKRENAEKPYTLRMTCPQVSNAEEKLDDISSEYAMNVQEDAYMSIIEKLKENNMEVAEEEVMDDNTIVLTVNVEN